MIGLRVWGFSGFRVQFRVLKVQNVGLLYEQDGERKNDVDQTHPSDQCGDATVVRHTPPGSDASKPQNPKPLNPKPENC